MEKEFTFTVNLIEGANQIMANYNIHINGYKPLCSAKFSTNGNCILEEFWWTDEEKATAWIFNQGKEETKTINFYVLYVKDTFR